MLILRSNMLAAVTTDTPVTPLNAVWTGMLRRPMTLPQLGHLFLFFPLGETAVSCANSLIDGDHYLWVTRPTKERPYTVIPQHPAHAETRLLLLLLSPDFIADMAGFLGIPPDFEHLLHDVPLRQGDILTTLLQLLATVDDDEEATDLFLEVVGQALHLLRLRHEALQKLSGHRQSTVADLLPRLLQARQFIEAHTFDPFKTSDVAAHVALSESHFARLFKTAFGVTVHQYRLRLRLDWARHLLEQPQASVTDTALAVGYRSLSAFIYAFRRRFAVSPSEYQARFQN